MKIKELNCPYCQGLMVKESRNEYKCVRCEKRVYQYDVLFESTNSSEKHYIDIIQEDGSTKTVEKILNFQFKDTKEEFLIYTMNEIDSSGNVTVYISRVERGKGYPSLVEVTDEQWVRVKEVIDELKARKSK